VLRLPAAAVSLLLAAAAHAQNWPSQPIHLVVPFTPGTGMDSIARTVGPELSKRLGQPVVVENKPGASGNIGADYVAKSSPDGHTLMLSANTLLIAANIYPQVPYKPLEAFEPVSLAAWGTLLLAASPKVPASTLADLIAQAKAKPGKLAYGSPGIGTPHHMAMEMFKELAGVDLLHVPYKGSAGATTDLLGGQIDVMFLPVHVAMPYVKAQKLKAYAVGSARRHPSAKEIPTLQELGVTGAEVDMWYAFLAPKGAPAAVVGKLNSQLHSILELPEVKSALDKQGLDATSSSPADLKALMAKDYQRWGEVIRKRNIRAD
jgi:tripartite-type tricarboxylate transporter receptor subunit TctC